jgi:hypothetical protein
VSPLAATVLGLLVDEERLRVVAALVLGARTPAEVAERAELDVARAGRALSRLVSGGLVTQLGDGYELRAQRLREAFDSLDRTPSAPVDSGLGHDADRVLAAFLHEGRLTRIPSSRSKRLVVLDYLAGRFEPGRTYHEPLVNEVLGAFHPDYASLRRYLVDEGFLERRDGFYWRAGGTFEV